MSESRGGEKRSRQRRGEEKGGVRGVIIMGEGGGYRRLEKVGNKGGRGQVVKKRRDVEWEKKMRGRRGRASSEREKGRLSSWGRERMSSGEEIRVSSGEKRGFSSEE